MDSINLIPVDMQLSIMRQCRVRKWSLAVSVAAMALVVVLGLDWTRRVNASELRAQNSEIRLQLEAARGELKSVAAEANQMLLQLERAKALRGKRAWSGMFALIGSCMPQECWLRSIATDPERPAIVAAGKSKRSKKVPEDESQAQVTIDAPRRLKISGYAHDAAQPHAFVANLKETEAFVAVTLESSKIEPVLDGTYTRFELVIEW